MAEDNEGQEPERPEKDALGRSIDWGHWEKLGLDGMRTDAAKRWRVDCQCDDPFPHWMMVESPRGAEYDRWLLHYHHTDPDCPTRKILMATYN